MEQDLQETVRKQEEDADVAPPTFSHSRGRDQAVVPEEWEHSLPTGRPVTGPCAAAAE